MATEDVIELGSSDEDAEPAPKKAKTATNPMQRIPRYLKEVSIKPAKSDSSSLSTKLVGRSLTIKKVINNVSVKPNSAESVKSNGKALRKQQRQVIKPLQKPIPVKQALNPINIKMSNSQMVINKFPVKIFNEQMKISNLPPGVTIKKALPTQKFVPANNGNKLNEQISNMKALNNISYYPKVNVMPAVKMMPNKASSKSSVGKVLTVNLDDDDAKPGSVSGPQWYLRPEEQEQREKIEEQNNSEPKCSNLIEITIEDSPIKPVSNKNEIGTEYAITIEDSPFKSVADGNKSINNSDEEIERVHRPAKSKKQLKYLTNDNRKTVEIEIEPIEVFESSQEINRNEVAKSENVENENNKKSLQFKEAVVPDISSNTDSAEKPQTQLNLETENKEENEFHPVYQSFIDLCFELENSDDMQKIVEKKIKGYYKQVPKEYTESEEFIDLVTGKINSMKAGPEKMYLYIKDIVDELNYKRKSFKTNASSIPEVKDGNETENSIYDEESEFDNKRQRQIRKLEKTLKKLHRAIQKLEEQEVDFDDEEDSVYLLTERYKARMIRVHAKFCQMTNTKMPSEPRVHIDPRPGQPAGPAKRLEKWINKKVPIGTPLPFPDFHDVLQCVREANKEDKLCWNEADIMEEARDLFIRCGKKLQRRRQENEWRLAASRISQEPDPSINNDELKKKLDQNQTLAVKKETELFNKYAEKQSEMKLEAVEIGDKEAEESPVETEDDDTDEEDASLGNTEKRKQRLKRLLQQRKDNEKIDNQEKGSPDKDDKLEDIKKTDVKTEDEITAMQLESPQTPNKQVNVIESVQSLSDDSSNINSDIDELHLLQKLHSEPELCTSTLESSDSGSLIAISDTLGSSSDSIKAASDDVISIENSSYSENEDYEAEDVAAKKSAESSEIGIVKENSNSNLEINCSTVFNVASEADVEKKFSKSNNDEYSQSVENILLASSDEDTVDGTLLNDNGNVYVNLNDDALSIEETMIESKNSPVSKDSPSTKDDAISLEKKSNQSEDNNAGNDVAQQMEVDSLKEPTVNNDKSEKSFLIEIPPSDNVIVTSISGNDMKADTTFCSVNDRKDNKCPDKHENNCDTPDEVVGSSTELMEVVTTTSPSDGVNG